MEEEKKLAELEKNAREAEDTEALLVDECAKLAKESDALIAQNETIEELIAKQKSINLELEVKLDGLRKASALKPEQQQVDGVRQGGYKVPWETLGNNRFMHDVIIPDRTTIFPRETKVSDLYWSTHAEPLRVTGKNLCDAEYKQVGKKLAGLGWQVNMARETTIFM
ncbi:MAG: hypothetical protein IJU76_05365 [Desulfovibrionaceae bacterium]|nr:hypothetical protein [Desulfovibrionaceae bacterium]